jgi:hypothetical protein
VFIPLISKAWPSSNDPRLLKAKEDSDAAGPIYKRKGHSSLGYREQAENFMAQLKQDMKGSKRIFSTDATDPQQVQRTAVDITSQPTHPIAGPLLPRPLQNQESLPLPLPAQGSNSPGISYKVGSPRRNRIILTIPNRMPALHFQIHPIYMPTSLHLLLSLLRLHPHPHRLTPLTQLRNPTQPRKQILSSSIRQLGRSPPPHLFSGALMRISIDLSLQVRPPGLP